MEKQKINYIWYASYGSNLLEERFLCYIKGGQPKGTNKMYLGCKDKSMPKDNKEFYITSNLYFAKSSRNWENGGVCFINTNFIDSAKTLSRIYLITEEQFIDVVKQEIEFSDKLIIDFEKIKKKGSYVIKKNSWYGNIIFLGIYNNYPIYTFTNEINLKDINKPSKSYLQTIIKGIIETHKLSSIEVFDYLSDKIGIRDFYTQSELLSIIENT